MDCVPVKKAVESRNHQFGGAQVYKEHPYVSLRKLTCSVSNPRIGPYPSPIGMEALVRIKVAFASNPVWSSKSGSLVVIGNDGIMTEYTLSISPSATAASSTTSATTQPRPNPDEAMIQCTLTPGAQYKQSADVRAPISEQNPMCPWFFPQFSPVKEKSEEENTKWISQVGATLILFWNF
ncbi:unnamed protein product [Gongylonema pulchrum]|uniref:MSP domain-containing protein n=1 Tax=Gongylonema pulchrum TaxID=637853 RepID=A0A183EPP1_9BILA|nr:unnamed protein product [Gongylonema pulchrum]